MATLSSSGCSSTHSGRFLPQPVLQPTLAVLNQNLEGLWVIVNHCEVCCSERGPNPPAPLEACASAQQRHNGGMVAMAGCNLYRSDSLGCFGVNRLASCKQYLCHMQANEARHSCRMVQQAPLPEVLAIGLKRDSIEYVKYPRVASLNCFAKRRLPLVTPCAQRCSTSYQLPHAPFAAIGCRQVQRRQALGVFQVQGSAVGNKDAQKLTVACHSGVVSGRPAVLVQLVHVVCFQAQLKAFQTTLLRCSVQWKRLAALAGWYRRSLPLMNHARKLPLKSTTCTQQLLLAKDERSEMVTANNHAWELA